MKRFFGNARLHLQSHRVLYVCISLLFIAGAACGAYYFQAIRGNVEAYFSRTLENYLRYVAEGNLDRWGLFFSTLSAGALTVGLITLLGLFRPTLPLAYIVFCGRGFTFGYSAALLVQLLGWQGAMIIALSLLPQMLLLLPFYGFAAALPILRLQRKQRQRGITPADAAYWELAFICATATSLAGLYNALISPLVLSGIVSLFDSILR